MRATLEQLKAMSDTQLFNHWLNNRFPFEKIGTCGHCLTQHGLYGLRGDSDASCDHRGMVTDISAVDSELNGRWWSIGVIVLRRNLEQLYALRLFYDSLYPPSEESPSPTVAIAESHSKSEVCP